MSFLAVVALVAVGWFLVGVVIGLVAGRIVRNRDRQIPKDPAAETAAQDTSETRDEAQR